MKVDCSKTPMISACCSAGKMGHAAACSGNSMVKMKIWILLVAVTVCLIFATYYAVLANGNNVNSFHVPFKEKPNQTNTATQKKTVKEKKQPVQFALAKHFQDHMVLQQAPARANIYGFSSEIGQQVFLQITSSLEAIVYETTVKEGPQPDVGTWSFKLSPVPRNTSASIIVTSKGLTLSLSDVLFGDVWLCSGQSNMEFTVTQMNDAEEELRNARNYPWIRLMTVDNAESPTPLYDLVVRQPWTVPNYASLGGPTYRYFSALCWLYGKAIHKALGYPIGLVATSYSATPVQVWSSPEVLAKCGVNTSIQSIEEECLLSRQFYQVSYPTDHTATSSVLWNAMVHPLLGMTIKGAIWYQGENDASGTRLTHYNCTFPSMIQDWRKNFHHASNGETDLNFPFGFVQLAGYRHYPTITKGFPDIRWHQTASHGYVPNADMVSVFMAVAMDLSDFRYSYDPIHPRNKQDVADRLTLACLSVAYGQNLVYQGPFPERLVLTSDGVVVSYGNRWNLTVRSLKGFELMCVNDTRKDWIQTKIASNNQTSVTLALTCGAGQNATCVRYAWQESPCDFKQCAIYETINNLPGPPFVLNISEGS